MRRNTLNISIAATTLTLAATAGAQELVKSDEHRLQQASQAYFMMAPSNGKLTFTATGTAADLVVIRLADGSVFATATVEQLLKGITGDNKLPDEKPAEEGAKPSLGTNKSDNNVASKSLAGPVELLRADFTFASIPWAFHGGSVTIYRGAQELDRDMILLY